MIYSSPSLSHHFPIIFPSFSQLFTGFYSTPMLFHMGRASWRLALRLGSAGLQLLEFNPRNFECETFLDHGNIYVNINMYIFPHGTTKRQLRPSTNSEKEPTEHSRVLHKSPCRKSSFPWLDCERLLKVQKNRPPGAVPVCGQTRWPILHIRPAGILSENW